MNTHKVGMALGMLFGLIHLIWEVLIFFGLAQGLLDFIMKMHSLSSTDVVQPFNLGNAVMLIVLTSVVGYVVGSVFASIYNKVHK